MASENDPSEESLASPDGPTGEGDLPEELSADAVDSTGDQAAELTGESGAEQADGLEDDKVPVAAGHSVADRARSSRPKRRSVSGPDAAREGSSGAPFVTTQRTTPARFVRQSVDELKKVSWPTWPEVQQLFWVVLILVLFVIAFVVSLDTLLGWGLLQLFG